MVHDTRADRLLVFGGTHGETLHNDVWEIELGVPAPAWRRLEVAGVLPPARAEHVAVFDSVNNRMVMFGGRDSEGALNDTWMLDLAGVPHWTRIGEGNTAPSARWDAGAVLDPLTRRMFVIGGRDESTTGPRDTWTLDLAESLTWRPFQVLGFAWATNRVVPWTWGPAVHDPMTGQIAIQGQSGIASFSLHAPAPEWTEQTVGQAYGIPSLDIAGRRVFLSGGRSGVWQCQLREGEGRLELWIDGQLAPAPDYRGLAPRAIFGQAVLYDARRARILAYGGCTLNDSSWGWLDGNLWAFDPAGNGSWSVIGPRPPKSASWPLLIHDSTRDELIYRSLNGESDFRVFHSRGLSPEAPWIQLTDSAWTTNDHLAIPSVPTGGIHDPLRDRLVFFSGSASGPPQLTQIPRQGPFVREVLPVVGPSAPQGEFGRVVYDATGDRLVAYGLGVDRSEVWALTFGGVPSWIRQDGAGRRPPVIDERLWVHDPDLNRILMFGGVPDTPPSAPDSVWELTLDGVSSWQVVGVPGVPPGRVFGAAAFDRHRRRIILAHDNNLGSVEVWSLELTGAPLWRQLTSTGMAPPDTRWASTLYDASRDQILFYGNTYGVRTLWTLRLGDQPTAARPDLLDATADEGRIWVRWYVGEGSAMVERSTARSDWHELGQSNVDGSGIVAYEDRAVVPGMEYGYRLRLADNSTTDPVFIVALRTRPTAASLALVGVHPNPSMGRFNVAFEAATEGHVVIEVFNLAGRRVYATNKAATSEGLQAIALDPGRLTAGVYFVRLTQGSAAVTTRILRFN